MIDALRRPIHENVENPLSGPLQITPYQAANVLLFRGISATNGASERIAPFAALGGKILPEEMTALDALHDRIQTEEGMISLASPDFSGLIGLAAELGAVEAQAALERLAADIELRIITTHDLSGMDNFGTLPIMAQYGFSQMGKSLLSRTKRFLAEGGIITFTEFRHPSKRYLNAVKNSPGESIVEKVDIALQSETDEVERVSHGFINAVAIPHNGVVEENSTVPTARDITKYLNHRIDRKEEDLAKVVLLQTLLHEEMKGAVRLLSVVGLSAGLLHLIQQEVPDSVLFESLVMFGAPIAADIVTFWSQLRPWLEGETPTERLQDFIKRLFSRQSHLRSFLISIGATSSATVASKTMEQEYGGEVAAAIYSLIPLLVAGITTYDTVKILKKRFGTSTVDTIRHMFAANPTHLGIDIGAIITFLTGVGVLAYGGQLHNMAAVALIEGAEEPAIAAGYTKLHIDILNRRRFYGEVSAVIKDWLADPRIRSIIEKKQG